MGHFSVKIMRLPGQPSEEINSRVHFSRTSFEVRYLVDHLMVTMIPPAALPCRARVSTSWAP